MDNDLCPKCGAYWECDCSIESKVTRRQSEEPVIPSTLISSDYANEASVDDVLAWLEGRA